MQTDCRYVVKRMWGIFSTIYGMKCKRMQKGDLHAIAIGFTIDDLQLREQEQKPVISFKCFLPTLRFGR
jgi:hypothetical protein